MYLSVSAGSGVRLALVKKKKKIWIPEKTCYFIVVLMYCILQYNITGLCFFQLLTSEQ